MVVIISIFITLPILLLAGGADCICNSPSEKTKMDDKLAEILKAQERED